MREQRNNPIHFGCMPRARRDVVSVAMFVAMVFMIHGCAHEQYKGEPGVQPASGEQRHTASAGGSESITPAVTNTELKQMENGVLLDRLEQNIMVLLHGDIEDASTAQRLNKETSRILTHLRGRVQGQAGALFDRSERPDPITQKQVDRMERREVLEQLTRIAHARQQCETLRKRCNEQVNAWCERMSDERAMMLERLRKLNNHDE